MPFGRYRFRFIIATLAILAVAVIVIWRATSSAPSWYRPPNVNDPAILRLADDVEYRLIEEAHRIRDNPDPWRLRLREHHANAWLAARLPRWIAHEKGMDWPSPFGTAQVHITSNWIELAGDVATSTGRRFLVARIVPSVQDEQLVVTVTALSLGRIALGSASVDRLLDSFAPDQKAELLESEVGSRLLAALAGESSFEPIMKLADGRRVILREITLHNGAIDLTVVTE